MLALAGNSSFSGIEMETIWTVAEGCISPNITYGGEVMDINKNNLKLPNSIMDNVTKRILKTPITTPREALYIETGILDPETKIKQNRISMESRIKRGNNQTMKEIIQLTTKKLLGRTKQKTKTRIRNNRK